MGNVTSKKTGVIPKTPEKGSVAATIEQSPTTDQTKFMLDPKTPAIPQTPLTQTIASHLNRIATNDVNQNQSIKTPSYLLRKKILYDLGYTYSIKDTDPRSPSQCIPRTPLNLADDVVSAVECETSSFQYNSTLEDSCRDFNTKLDDITIEEADGTKQGKPNENGKNDNGDGDECPESLCDQRTPDCDFENSPVFENRKGVKPEAESPKNEGSDIVPTPMEKHVEKEDSFISTPIIQQRTGRIPLSVINRRGVPGEITPMQTKNNTSATFSVEKHRKELSFNDENRGSARKSKIPVYKK